MEINNTKESRESLYSKVHDLMKRSLLVNKVTTNGLFEVDISNVTTVGINVSLKTVYRTDYILNYYTRVNFGKDSFLVIPVTVSVERHQEPVDRVVSIPCHEVFTGVSTLPSMGSLLFTTTVFFYTCLVSVQEPVGRPLFVT